MRGSFERGSEGQDESPGRSPLAEPARQASASARRAKAMWPWPVLRRGQTGQPDFGQSDARAAAFLRTIGDPQQALMPGEAEVAAVGCDGEGRETLERAGLRIELADCGLRLVRMKPRRDEERSIVETEEGRVADPIGERLPGPVPEGSPRGAEVGRLWPRRGIPNGPPRRSAIERRRGRGQRTS